MFIIFYIKHPVVELVYHIYTYSEREFNADFKNIWVQYN